MTQERISSLEETSRARKTRLALFWMNLANEPFVVLFALLQFIMRKDLGATALQISILVALKPVLSVFSFYWSANLAKRRDKLRSNLLGAWAMARLPFLFVPWIDSIWYLIFAAGVYQLFHRAGNPALIEILKLNISKEPREKAFSSSFVLSFAESVLLGLAIGHGLDGDSSLWKMLFFGSTLIGLTSLFFQWRIPIPEAPQIAPPPPPNFKERFIKPWIDSFRLMRERPDFAHFQWGFMIGGTGLMLLAPALPLFFADILNLSHLETVNARSILMGIGIILSTTFWRRGISEIRIPLLTSWILAGFGLFAFVLYFAQFNVALLYTAYLLYGIAQAGSHLLWNLSGTLFAKEEESSLFSCVNILMVGIRGAIAPLLGGLLCDLIGPPLVLLIGTAVCFAGAGFMLVKREEVKETT